MITGKIDISKQVKVIDPEISLTITTEHTYNLVNAKDKPSLIVKL